MGEAMAREGDWTRGPAKHAAAAVLVVLSLVALLASRNDERADDVPRIAAGALIDVNTASADELELLPRVGPALAKRIVEDREARGPFKSVDDLDRVPGIGKRTVERMKGFARVGSPISN